MRIFSPQEVGGLDFYNSLLGITFQSFYHLLSNQAERVCFCLGYTHMFINMPWTKALGYAFQWTDFC